MEINFTGILTSMQVGDHQEKRLTFDKVDPIEEKVAKPGIRAGSPEEWGWRSLECKVNGQSCHLNRNSAVNFLERHGVSVWFWNREKTVLKKIQSVLNGLPAKPAPGAPIVPAGAVPAPAPAPAAAVPAAAPAPAPTAAAPPIAPPAAAAIAASPAPAPAAAEVLPVVRGGLEILTRVRNEPVGTKDSVKAMIDYFSNAEDHRQYRYRSRGLNIPEINCTAWADGFGHLVIQSNNVSDQGRDHMLALRIEDNNLIVWSNTMPAGQNKDAWIAALHRRLVGMLPPAVAESATPAPAPAPAPVAAPAAPAIAPAVVPLPAAPPAAAPVVVPLIPAPVAPADAQVERATPQQLLRLQEYLRTTDTPIFFFDQTGQRRCAWFSSNSISVQDAFQYGSETQADKFGVRLGVDGQPLSRYVDGTPSAARDLTDIQSTILLCALQEAERLQLEAGAPPLPQAAPTIPSGPAYLVDIPSPALILELGRLRGTARDRPIRFTSGDTEYCAWVARESPFFVCIHRPIEGSGAVPETPPIMTLRIDPNGNVPTMWVLDQVTTLRQGLTQARNTILRGLISHVVNLPAPAAPAPAPAAPAPAPAPPAIPLGSVHLVDLPSADLVSNLDALRERPRNQALRFTSGGTEYCAWAQSSQPLRVCIHRAIAGNGAAPGTPLMTLRITPEGTIQRIWVLDQETPPQQGLSQAQNTILRGLISHIVNPPEPAPAAPAPAPVAAPVAPVPAPPTELTSPMLRSLKAYLAAHHATSDAWADGAEARMLPFTAADGTKYKAWFDSRPGRMSLYIQPEDYVIDPEFRGRIAIAVDSNSGNITGQWVSGSPVGSLTADQRQLFIRACEVVRVREAQIASEPVPIETSTRELVQGLRMRGHDRYNKKIVRIGNADYYAWYQTVHGPTRLVMQKKATYDLRPTTDNDDDKITMGVFGSGRVCNVHVNGVEQNPEDVIPLQFHQWIRLAQQQVISLPVPAAAGAAAIAPAPVAAPPGHDPIIPGSHQFSADELLTFKTALRKTPFIEHGRGARGEQTEPIPITVKENGIEKNYMVYYACNFPEDAAKYQRIIIQRKEEYDARNQRDKLVITINSHNQVSAVSLDNVEQTTHVIPPAYLARVGPALREVLKKTSEYNAGWSTTNISLIERSLQEVPEHHLEQLTTALKRSIENSNDQGIKVTFLRNDLTATSGVDAGGLSRDYLSGLAQNIASSPALKFFDVDGDTIRKMPRTQADYDPAGPLPSLTDREQTVYRQLGNVMMYCYNSRNHSYGHYDSTLFMGRNFDDRLFKAALTLTSAEIDTPFAQLSVETQLKIAAALVDGTDEAAAFTTMRRDYSTLSTMTEDELMTVASYIPLPEDYYDADLNPIRQKVVAGRLTVVKAALKRTLLGRESESIGLIATQFAPIHAIAQGMKAFCNPGELTKIASEKEQHTSIFDCLKHITRPENPIVINRENDPYVAWYDSGTKRIHFRRQTPAGVGAERFSMKVDDAGNFTSIQVDGASRDELPLGYKIWMPKVYEQLQQATWTGDLLKGLTTTQATAQKPCKVVFENVEHHVWEEGNKIQIQRSAQPASRLTFELNSNGKIKSMQKGGVTIGALDAKDISLLHKACKVFQTNPQWDKKISKLSGANMSAKVQGSANRTLIADSIKLSSTLNAALESAAPGDVARKKQAQEILKKVKWLQEWIKGEPPQGATAEQVASFLKFVSGATSLPHGKVIEIQQQVGEYTPLPKVHTCSIVAEFAPEPCGIAGADTPNDHSREAFLKVFKDELASKAEYQVS